MLLMDPLTVYKMDGFYHSWATAAPCILSHLAFGIPLSEKGLKSVIDYHSPQVSSGSYNFIRGWWGKPTNQDSPRPLTTHSHGQSPTRASQIPHISPKKSPAISNAPLPDFTPKIKFAKSIRMTSEQLVLSH